MEKTNGRLVGILGTVIIHLIIGIMIMGFKIRELHVKANVILDLELFTEFENNNFNNNEELRLSESSGTSIERVLQGDEEMLNIARNLASTAANPIISREDYIDMVKEELIRSGQLGVDNYIDQQRRQSSNSDNDNYVPVHTLQSSVRNNEAREPLEREAAANYEGRTRIEYFLEGRMHTYLHIPIYKCQGAGIVTLQIEVNPRGDVIKATVVARVSVTDQCLIETAINSALVSRFESDINAPRVQIGTLTFQFVAQ